MMPKLSQKIEMDIQAADPSGVECEVTSITPGQLADRRRVTIITWSHTALTHLKTPMKVRDSVVGQQPGCVDDVCSANARLCKHFALIVARLWEGFEANGGQAGGRHRASLEAIVAQPEYHANGGLHLHCILRASSKTFLFAALHDALKRDGFATHFKTVSSTRPFDVLFKYLMVARPAKPYIFTGYMVGDVDQQLIDASEKSKVKYMGRIANEVDIDCWVRQYAGAISDLRAWKDAMAMDTPPNLPGPPDVPGRKNEDPSLHRRFKAVQKWWIKNQCRVGGAHVQACLDRRQRVASIAHRSYTPRMHLDEIAPAPCSKDPCPFATAWETMLTLNDLGAFVKYVRLYYTDALPYGGPESGGRPRNIVFTGPPSCGKSLLERLLLWCIPKERVFRMKTGSFPYEGISDLPSLMVVASSDFRFTPRIEVESFLLGTEGKCFNVDGKGTKNQDIQGPVIWIFSSNNFVSGAGWGQEDIAAAHERFIEVPLTPIPRSKRMKQLDFCQHCAKSIIEDIVNGVGRYSDDGASGGNTPAPKRVKTHD